MSYLLKPFYMIRHGQTEANKAQLLAGSMDSPLTDLGISQAREARFILDALPRKPDVIYHSNLSRARDTARLINEGAALPMKEDAGLAEVHMGDWEGQPYDATDSKWRGLFFEGLKPPNGEDLQTFTHRVITSKNKALSAGHDLPLIVCHGGVFRAFARYYNADNQHTMNCVLHYFEPDSDSLSFPWRVYTYTLNNGGLVESEIEFTEDMFGNIS